MEYAGFWQRFGACWLDILVLLPLIILVILGGEQWRLFHLYYLLPGLLIGLWFHVYLVKRYGGTPGKLMLNIRITKLDGSNVGYREAILRYLVIFFLSIPISIGPVLVALNMTDAEYFSMGWQERTSHMNEQGATWYHIANLTMSIWVWGEFIIMLTNKKRRAIHDFMAGTVVIHKPL